MGRKLSFQLEPGVLPPRQITQGAGFQVRLDTPRFHDSIMTARLFHVGGFGLIGDSHGRADLRFDFHRHIVMLF